MANLETRLAPFVGKPISVEGSRVAQIYRNFGVHPDKVQLLKCSPILITGSDAEGEIRVVEY